MDNYKLKYLKYKKKYLDLKNRQNHTQTGGSDNKANLILFKAEWCGHCQNFKPTWESLQKNISNVNFITYDADSNESEMQKYNVEGFPTLMLEKDQKLIEFNKERNIDNILEFVNENLN